MANNSKNIILAIVIVLIAFSIFYLQGKKDRVKEGSVHAEIISLANNSSATSTDSGLQTQTVADRSAIIKDKAKKYQSAIEIIPGGSFINSEPFTLKSLIGKKVILLDFWAYSCINCQRTTPYLNAWYEKYKDQGFVIVGVHTPEFDFEKVYANVLRETNNQGIKYPVVQDNNYATWNAYGNRYWPHEYLIDIDGFIVHDKIGEGGYDESERQIQKALRERSEVLGMDGTISSETVKPANVIMPDTNALRSPEIYFGAARNQYLGNGLRNLSGSQNLSLPLGFKPNTLYLSGAWTFDSESAQNTDDKAKIVFKYNAKNVYLVASSESGVKIKVLRDGKTLDSEAGSDVAKDSTVLIKENRLYKLIEGTGYGEHTLEIEIESTGLKAFTFTFG